MKTKDEFEGLLDTLESEAQNVAIAAEWGTSSAVAEKRREAAHNAALACYQIPIIHREVLLEACKTALKHIAILTPIPIDDELMDPVIKKVIEVTDIALEYLRTTIAMVEKEE